MYGTEKWITVNEYVDIETGEIITKSLYEREYYTVKIDTKFEINGNFKIRKNVKICRKHGQTKLF